MECSFESHSARELISHVEQEGHNEYPFIICPSCSEDIDIREIEGHYRRCVRPRRRKKKAAGDGEEEEEDEAEEAEKEKKVHGCSECGKVFGRRAKLQMHLKSHMRAQGGD